MKNHSEFRQRGAIREFEHVRNSMRSHFLPTLTGRELAALKLLGLGMSEADIAERLRVSPGMLAARTSSMRTKLLLDSNAALASFAADAMGIAGAARMSPAS